MRRLLCCALVLLASGCASYTALSPEDRGSLEQELTRPRPAYLKLSFYVTPFFGDASKRLLTAVPPDEVRLLDNPNGTPINPGQPERILPAGTRVKILKVEFPTAFAVSERMVYTPRTQPWVYLQAEGDPGSTALILVLPPKLDTKDQFVSDLQLYVTDQDPEKVLAGFSEAVRRAVKQKNAVVDMPSQALEMAWGYPEHINTGFEGAVRREDWTWPGGSRVAHLSDGRVTALDTEMDRKQRERL